MTLPAATSLEHRVLVLAPTGRDASLTAEVLVRHHISSEPCADMAELCFKLEQGAGALLIAEEALTSGALKTLALALHAQAPWSDVPIIVSTTAGDVIEARIRGITALEPSGNVTILERPVRVFTMIVTVQAALRARGRQYQMRDLHHQMQEQMSSLQSERELRARFVSLLAHDLRGPVSAAMLGAEMLARNPERMDQRRDMGIKIKRNLERVDNMVRDLLDTTRIQAGQPLPLRLDLCDLATIASEVVDELNHLHGERVRLESRQVVTGMWSAEELRRAVWNLTSNALKYGTEDTPVTITARTQDGRARLTVHNVGNPLSPEEQRKIFEPFARAMSAQAGAQVGWGLGLTLVRGCVEAHGGRVSVESSAEAGTVFTLDLPLDSRPFQPGYDVTKERREAGVAAGRPIT